MSRNAPRLLSPLLCLTAVGCSGDPARSSTPTAPPATGSAGADEIAGTWLGRFDTGSADCHTDTPANATFEWEGDRLTGTLNAVNACGLEDVRFIGTFSAGNVEGNLSRGDFTGYAAGTLANGRLELQTSALWSRTGGTRTPAGQMHLHRP